MWLITGAKGFVGSGLTHALSVKGYEFRITTRTKTPDDNSNVFETGELGPSTSWSPILEGVNGVIHLAARVHILKETSQNPQRAFYHANTEATLNLAKEAVKVGVRRFIYISSVGVNGRITTSIPFQETDPPKPHNDYAASKWAAEQGLADIAKTSDMEVVIIRPPLIYGPGVGANFLRLMRLVYSGFPLPLGSIKNQRSLISIYNLVDFLLCCMEHPNAAGQTFLVADGEDISTPELIRRLAKYMGKRANLIPFPQLILLLGGRLLGREVLIDGLTRSLQVNTSKARDLLSWNPPVSVDEALRITTENFLENLTNSN